MMCRNIAKRILVKLIVFSFCVSTIKSYSAIVSEDNGNAFITKIEFENLKEDFSKQIDQYNSSLNGKIDGAVSDYLAGINLAEKPEISWDTLTKELGGKSLIFKNKFSETTDDITTEVNLSITRDLCARGEWGISCARKFYESGWKYNASYPNDHSRSAVNGAVWLFGVGATNAGDYVENYSNRLVQFRSTDTTHYEGDGPLYQYQSDLRNLGANNWSVGLSKCVWSKKSDIQTTKTETIEGSGKAFIYHKAANGNIYLREFANVWPILNIDIWRHDYKDYTFSTEPVFQSYYLNDNGKAITDSQIEETAVEHHEYGSWTQGTKYTGTSETSGTYLSGSVIQMKANDGLDYSLFQYGTGLNSNIVCLQDTAVPKAETDTTSFTATGMKWNAVYFNEYGKRKQVNDFNNLKLTYTNIKQENERIDPSIIVNKYISNVAGENVRLGGGAPLLYTYADGDDIILTLKFSSTGAATDTVHYIVSDKQFNKGVVVDGATVIQEGNAVVGNEVEVRISSENKQQYWINMYSNTAGKDCTISSISYRMR